MPRGYLCADWEGFDCDTATSIYRYTEDQENELKEKCCKTCVLGEGGQDSPTSEPTVEASGGDLDMESYEELCTAANNDKAACESYGCKHKGKDGKKGKCKVAKSAKKVKCKKVTDMDVCERLGCEANMKKAKCKGKASNL
eukprot:TRINITY_DN719_c0_g1_i2.p2 TRINITY_DN719_c0_g1~~TRINITY_DN719_c0_g1_i2.p2  ORF type:complete len:141 (-),score=50.23 TRINITY_DN719_c0_g1_i2:80-502(-)